MKGYQRHLKDTQEHPEGVKDGQRWPKGIPKDTQRDPKRTPKQTTRAQSRCKGHQGTRTKPKSQFIFVQTHDQAPQVAVMLKKLPPTRMTGFPFTTPKTGLFIGGSPTTTSWSTSPVLFTMLGDSLWEPALSISIHREIISTLVHF